uniref:Transmembrane protein n=1 Tax=Odontella aurita TaxID=265563 RepID=A0A7S4JTW0_9STRA|mmetsp:Transcript_5383/g.15705  ORF Transcript_5383/g.15705 Transcript_5383/m.15705 type:complete len:570 (+) Transcript_5383:193-1902(+)
MSKCHKSWPNDGMFASGTRTPRNVASEMQRTTRALLFLTFCTSFSQGFQLQTCPNPNNNPSIARPRRSLTTKLPQPLSTVPTLNRSITVTTTRYYVTATSEGDDEEETKDEDDDEDDELSRTKRRVKVAAKQIRALIETEEKQDQFQFMLALLPSFLAFFAWENISLALANFLEACGDVSGLFADNLLRPTITGVVVPVIAIALATLVSTTINVLRDREVQLRTLINKESCDLRLLRRAVFGLFGTRQHASRRARALALLCSYTQQLERETTFGAVEALEELQLSGGIAANELDQLTKMLHGIDGAAASRQGSVSYADDLVRSLNEYRSQRVAELLSGFPAIHWGVLILLSFSVCGTFLLASNQPMNQYLNSVSLRVLFALLVGVCSGTATICLNLADPFRGTFSILEASAQLRDLRLCLEEDVAEATAEAGEISSSLVNAILLGGSKDSSGINSGSIVEPLGQQIRDKYLDTTGQSGNWEKAGNFKSKTNREPRRYGLMSTVYFHLLTGPFGSNMKALGDVIAWFATFVASRTKSFSQRVMALSMAFGKRSQWWRRRRMRRNVTSKNL